MLDAYLSCSVSRTGWGKQGCRAEAVQIGSNVRTLEKTSCALAQLVTSTGLKSGGHRFESDTRQMVYTFQRLKVSFRFFLSCVSLNAQTKRRESLAMSSVGERTSPSHASGKIESPARSRLEITERSERCSVVQLPCSFKCVLPFFLQPVGSQT